jgi:hypothetical protein
MLKIITILICLGFISCVYADTITLESGQRITTTDLWSEKWKVTGTSKAKEYEVKFKFIPGGGTDFSVNEIKNSVKE